jgi:hypothetical protein
MRRGPGRPKGSKSKTKVFPTSADSFAKVSFKDISDILKLSHQLHVSKVKLGDFYFEFHPRSQSPGDQPNSYPFLGVKPEENVESVPDELRILSDTVQDEFYKAQLMMDDPQAYETLMIDAERQRSGLHNETKDN